MSTLAWPRARAAGTWLALTAVLALSGAMIVAAPRDAALLVAVAAAVCVAADWRRGVGILVAFLPFAGLPVFLLNSRYGPIAKDIVIVVPLYLGFVVSRLHRRERILPAGDPVLPLLGLFAALAFVYALLSPSLTVAGIGLKVWLFYLPLYVVGHAYVRDREDVVRLLRRTARLAVIPAGIAFAELYFFVRTGGFGPLLQLYGRFSSSMVRQVGFGTVIPRIPSTFTFAGSYYDFGLVGLAAALGYWALRRNWQTAALAVTLALATLASGERRSYFTVPLLVAVFAGLTRAGTGTRLRVALSGAATFMLLIALGVPVLGISGQLQEGVATNVGAASQQLAPVLQHGLVGHGTGSGTNAAFRYGGLAPTTGWAEAWYTKALVEMGYLGLGLAILLVAVMLVQGFRRVQAMPSSDRGLAAPLWALLFVTSLMLAKAAEIDWDPLDAYFWLFAGLLSGLSASTRQRDAAGPGRRPSDRRLPDEGGTLSRLPS